MPSDHSSIAARHRARKLSRAKSLRKHTRWLVQQQEKHQSQPDLRVSQADKLEFSQTLRRAISLKSHCTSNAASSASPSASTSTLVDTNYPFTSGIARSRSGSGFPWREVQWTQSRRKIGTRISPARGLLLTPYPPTTTRVVSRATAVCEGKLVAGKVEAMKFLEKTTRKYLPPTISTVNEQVKVTNTATVQIPRAKELMRPMSSGNHVTNDPDTICSTTKTSSSQVSDSGALMYLYAVAAAQARRERQRQDSSANLKSPPREKTHSHVERGQGETQAPSWNAREGKQQQEQKRPLLPPISQRQVSDRERDKSPQRHQRDRHPRLIFPYAPESGIGFGLSQSHSHFHAQADTLSYASHHNTQTQTHAPQHNPDHTSIHNHNHKHIFPTPKIRKFIDGHWRCITSPTPSSHPELSTSDTATGTRSSSEYRNKSTNDGECEGDRVKGKGKGGDKGKGRDDGVWSWSRTRSSISALGTGTGFWPAGPRRILRVTVQ